MPVQVWILDGHDFPYKDDNLAVSEPHIRIEHLKRMGGGFKGFFDLHVGSQADFEPHVYKPILESALMEYHVLIPLLLMDQDILKCYERCIRGLHRVYKSGKNIRIIG